MTSVSNTGRRQPSVTRRQVLGTSAAGIAALGMPAIARGAVPSIPVAVVVGLTGATAPWGVPSSDAARLVAAEINANGGVKSKGGAMIDLIVADHQSKPEMAGTLMERVISLQKVVCIIGNSYSGASMVGSKVAEAGKTPMLSLDTAESLSQRGLKYFYRIGPRTSILAAAAVDFAAGAVKEFNTPPKKVAIMADDTTFSQDSVKGLLANLPKTGWNVVDNISYPGGGVADFTSMIQRLKVMGVDLVFQSTFAPDGIGIVRAMKAVDFNPMAAVHVSGAPLHAGLQFGAEGGRELHHVFRRVRSRAGEVEPLPVGLRHCLSGARQATARRSGVASLRRYGDVARCPGAGDGCHT